MIPAAEHGTTLRVYVGGVTAVNGDFAAVIAPKLLIFIGVILVLGFLLLTLAFRSLLIPAVAAVMNLLAAAASFGVLVAVFQYGWGLHVLNLGQAGPIESFLPVLMLAVLFGLSMDYEVFLVSRIREEWATTGDNHQAVRTGQATTGRVIIAAATIMILVFSAFILSGQQTIGEIGIGLAAAVLLDAFLLRTVLVPAVMHLSGRANWWLPAGWTASCRTCPSNPPPSHPPRPPPRLPRPRTARRPDSGRALSACAHCPAVTVTLEAGGAGTYTQRAIPGAEVNQDPCPVCYPGRSTAAKAERVNHWGTARRSCAGPSIVTAAMCRASVQLRSPRQIRVMFSRVAVMVTETG